MAERNSEEISVQHRYPSRECNDVHVECASHVISGDTKDKSVFVGGDVVVFKLIKDI